jgi:hypothetical protein
MRNVKRAIHQWYIYLAILLTAVLLGVSLFFTLRPYNELTFGEYYVDNEMYRAGDFVTVTISEFCTSGIPNTNERWLDNSIGGVSLPPLRFNGTGEPACFKDLQFKVQIPTETVPGQYRLEFITRYQPNPIRTISVATYTPYFYVTK